MSNVMHHQESPFITIDLDKLEIDAELLTVNESPFHGHIIVRGDPSNSSFLSIVEEATGVQLPVQTNSFSEANGVKALWYGPTEWLLLTPPNQEQHIFERLDSALQGHFAVADVSGGNTILNLTGKLVRELLSCGSMMDFHPSVFSTNTCAQTLFAKTNVTVLRTGADEYQLIVRRSFADYLGHWIIDCSNNLSLT